MNTAIEKLLEQFSKLGFGFALGAGLGGITFIALSSIITITISPLVFLYSGGALGLGLNKLADRIVNLALKPIYDYINFYFKLLEIMWLKKWGMISEKTAKKLSQKLISRRFIGEDIELDDDEINIKKMLNPPKEEGLDLNQKPIEEKNPVPNKVQNDNTP